MLCLIISLFANGYIILIHFLPLQLVMTARLDTRAIKKRRDPQFLNWVRSIFCQYDTNVKNLWGAVLAQANMTFGRAKRLLTPSSQHA